jgi:hypothetical protein
VFVSAPASEDVAKRELLSDGDETEKRKMAILGGVEKTRISTWCPAVLANCRCKEANLAPARHLQDRTSTNKWPESFPGQ